MALYYKNSQGETKSFQYIIESVSEQELVIHENQGSLPKGLYEVMAYGDYSFYNTEEKDEGSYARTVYHVLDDDAAKAYWEEFPAK